MDNIDKQIMTYMRTHWPSEVKPEWRITDQMYPTILQKILKDFTSNATKSHQFFRIAGQSGSGKTSQLLPAVEAFFRSRNEQPVLVAARLLAPYHPFAAEIEAAYGTENFRKKTDEVSTILMFLTLKSLIAEGYDIILDVTLLDPIVESALVQMLKAQKYELRLTMVALSKEISDKFISDRPINRATRNNNLHTIAEFWRVMHLALDFYAKNCPKMPATIWSAWDKQPIYDGPIGDKKAIQTIKKYQQIINLPPETPTEDDLRQAKITHFLNIQNG